jgi:hypothetical protein
LYSWTFCICGRFVEGYFVEEDVLYRRMFCIGGRFVDGHCVEGRFVGRTFCSEGRFVEGRFVLAPALQPNLHCYKSETLFHQWMEMAGQKVLTSSMGGKFSFNQGINTFGAFFLILFQQGPTQIVRYDTVCM